MSLRFFRKKRNMKIITIVIGAFTIPGFIFYGISMSRSSNKDYAAIVNGEPITLQKYYNQLNKIEINYSERLGADYTKKITNSQIEKNVIDNMIDEKILNQQCKKYHIKVSHDEILKVIESASIFQNKNGQFSKSKFKDYFSNMSPEEMNTIEQGLKQQIMYQKLKQFIVSQKNIVVNNADIKQFITKKTPQKEIEQIRELVLKEKEDNRFQQWFNNVKKNSKIQIFISIKNTAPIGPTEKTVPTNKTSVPNKNE